MNLLLFAPEERLEGNRVCLRDYRLKHLRSVLDAGEGDTLRVGEIDGNMGQGRLTHISHDEAIIEVDLTDSPPAKIPLTLILALPRPKMLRRILRMVAEFGVGELHLLNSYRVEKSYWQTPVLQGDSVEEFFMQGLEQARDTVLPILHIHKRFKPFVEDELPRLLEGQRALLAHPGDYPPCPNSRSEEHTVLVIGPEGGFIPYEVEKLQEAGCATISLGPRILRVENAVAGMLSSLG